MTTLQILKQFQKLDTNKVIHDAMEETSPDITEYNKRQLYSGYSSKGQRLRKYSTPDYSELKNEMNPVPGFGNPDLYLTGAFYREFKTEIRGERIDTFSTDEKSDLLQKIYSNIFHLNDEYKGLFIKEKLKPVLIRRILKELSK